MDSKINNKENTNGKKKLSPLAKLLGITEETIKDTKTKASSDTSDDEEKLGFNQNFQNPVFDKETDSYNKFLENKIIFNNSSSNIQSNSNLNYQNNLNKKGYLCQNDYYKNIYQDDLKQKTSPICYYYFGIDKILSKTIESFVDINNKNFIEKQIYYNNYNNNNYYIPYQLFKNNSLNGINDNDKKLNKNIQNHNLNNNDNLKNKKGKPFVGRNGDWICGNCRNLNFAFRIMCNRCHLSKNESEKIISTQFEKQNYVMSNLMNNTFQNPIKI